MKHFAFLQNDTQLHQHVYGISIVLTARDKCVIFLRIYFCRFHLLRTCTLCGVCSLLFSFMLIPSTPNIKQVCVHTVTGSQYALQLSCCLFRTGKCDLSVALIEGYRRMRGLQHQTKLHFDKKLQKEL